MPVSIQASLLQGLWLERTHLVLQAAPRARPKKKQAKTRAVAPVVAPKRSMSFRVHKISWERAAAPLSNAINRASLGMLVRATLPQKRAPCVGEPL